MTPLSPLEAVVRSISPVQAETSYVLYLSEFDIDDRVTIVKVKEPVSVGNGKLKQEVPSLWQSTS